MLTYLVIRLCLQGSKSSFQLTRSSNFMPSLACTYSMYGLILVCVIVSSTLMLLTTHFSPSPSPPVILYVCTLYSLDLKLSQLNRLQSTIEDMGLCVTGVITDYRRQCRHPLITFLQYWPHDLILSHYFVIVAPSVTWSHDLFRSNVRKSK